MLQISGTIPYMALTGHIGLHLSRTRYATPDLGHLASERNVLLGFWFCFLSGVRNAIPFLNVSCQKRTKSGHGSWKQLL